MYTSACSASTGLAGASARGVTGFSTVHRSLKPDVENRMKSSNSSNKIHSESLTFAEEVQTYEVIGEGIFYLQLCVTETTDKCKRGSLCVLLLTSNLFLEFLSKECTYNDLGMFLLLSMN